MKDSQVKNELCGRNSMCKGPEAKENTAYWKKRQQAFNVVGSWNMAGD